MAKGPQNPQPSPKYRTIPEEECASYGLTTSEWKNINLSLGRAPNEVECGLISFLWSDRCRNRSGQIFMKGVHRESGNVAKLPFSKVAVIELGFGEKVALYIENTNIDAVTDTGAAAESGLATSVDSILSVGAKPLALMQSLHFGPPESPRTSHDLKQAVVASSFIAHRLGLPLAAGEAVFLPGYAERNLVTSGAVGLLNELPLTQRAKAGDVVIYLGEKTGGLDSTGKRLRSVDPLLLNLVSRYLLEAARTGKISELVAVGTGGIANAAFSLARKVNKGMSLFIDNIPSAVKESTPQSLLLNEGCERWLFTTSMQSYREIADALSPSGITTVSLGELLESNDVEFLWKHNTLSLIPFPLVTGETEERTYELCAFPPMLKKGDLDSSSARVVNLQTDSPLEDQWVDLLANPNLCSRKPIIENQKQGEGAGTLVGAGNNCSLVLLNRSKDRPQRALALTTDSNVLYCQTDPYLGAALSAAEALRNITVAGATPIAAAQSLSFGDPDEYRQISAFSEAVRGFTDACRMWNIPIVNDTVSFKNVGHTGSIPPTPAIFMVGIMPNIEHHCRQNFRDKGDIILLLGETADELGCSQYLNYCHRRVDGLPPDLNFERERARADTIFELIQRNLLTSAHDLSGGGLALALVESCVTRPGKPIGAHLELADQKIRDVAYLFSETSARYLVSCKPSSLAEIERICEQSLCPITGRGKVGGKEISVSGAVSTSISLQAATNIWGDSLSFLLEGIELANLRYL